MAYNNGFPVGYQYYQQPTMPQVPQQIYMPQQPIQQQVQQPVQQPSQTIQGGFVRVRNENEARMYPVAPANSVTFVDENMPFVYTKTVNMGQLDRPIFEKYRLVKEDDVPVPPEAPQRAAEVQQVDLSTYATKADMAAFRGDLDAIKTEIETFRGDLYGIAGKKKATAKK